MRRLAHPIAVGVSCPDLRVIDGGCRCQLEARASGEPDTPPGSRRGSPQATHATPATPATPATSTGATQHIVSSISFQNSVWSASTSPTLTSGTPLHFPPQPPDINVVYLLTGESAGETWRLVIPARDYYSVSCGRLVSTVLVRYRCEYIQVSGSDPMLS